MALIDKLNECKGVYLLEKHRQESFKNWPFDEGSGCSVSKMAEAGFYWCGNTTEPDTVSCFVCEKTLDGWEATDEPWREHAKHAPQCLFVQLNKKECELTVEEFINIFAVVVKHKMERNLQKQLAEFDRRADDQLKTFLEKQ